MAKFENLTDADYQAMNDARSLMYGEVIRADPERLKKAVEWAKKLAKEENAEAEAMVKIANIKTDG